MRDMWGYAFSCPLTLEEMFQRLNQLGPWTWIERDNDRWGSYISADVLHPHGRGVVRIIDDPSIAGFGISASLEVDAPDPNEHYRRLRTRIFDELLPAMGAVIRRESDDYFR